MPLTRALVRPPSRTFADGLTTAGLGRPDVALALAQHERYCEALSAAGLEPTRLPPDDFHPDACFVEDVAVLTGAGAVFTRPGAVVRRGEVHAVRAALADLVPTAGEIEAPGTLDGGDVCDADGSYLIGLSGRTDESGARQLAEILRRHGRPSTIVSVRDLPGVLHLKSGLAYLGDGRFAVARALLHLEPLRGKTLVPLDDDESYAANAVRINDTVLVAAGYPRFEAAVRTACARVGVVEMSEFRKMDGGLSCLSLRF